MVKVGKWIARHRVLMLIIGFLLIIPSVIGMALSQYEDDVHDVESGVITIQPKPTRWDDEYSQMTHFHDPVVPTDHAAPQIPTTTNNAL